MRMIAKPRASTSRRVSCTARPKRPHRRGLKLVPTRISPTITGFVYKTAPEPPPAARFCIQIRNYSQSAMADDLERRRAARLRELTAAGERQLAMHEFAAAEETFRQALGLDPNSSAL